MGLKYKFFIKGEHVIVLITVPNYEQFIQSVLYFVAFMRRKKYLLLIVQDLVLLVGAKRIEYCIWMTTLG